MNGDTIRLGFRDVIIPNDLRQVIEKGISPLRRSRQKSVSFKSYLEWERNTIKYIKLSFVLDGERVAKQGKKNNCQGLNLEMNLAFGINLKKGFLWDWACLDILDNAHKLLAINNP